MSRETPGWGTLGLLIRKRREELRLSQHALAELVSNYLGTPFHQTGVSENEKGNRWERRPELVGAYMEVLRLSDSEVNAALYGTRAAEEGRRMTFEEFVMSDPSLSDAAKAHIVNQYGLLQEASAYSRTQRRQDHLITEKDIPHDHPRGGSSAEGEHPPRGADAG